MNPIQLISSKFITVAIAFVCLCKATLAAAQVVGPYQNTTVATLDNTTNCGGGEFTRVITVPPADVFIIGSMEVGFLASHTWRGDIRLDLQSPAGTTVRLINDDTTNTGSPDNVNVHLADTAATVIYTAPHTTNDGLVAPPYENLVSPHNPLSAFYGESGAGNWTFTICDNYPTADNGQFRRANLYFTAATDADLSLTLGANDTTPDIGTNVVLTYELTHSGPVSADGVTVSLPLPSGLSYVSDNGGGAYNSITNVWTVPGSLSNTSTSLQLTAYVNSSGSFAITSEVATSNQVDPDSTPGNGNTSEDDYAALTLVPVTPAVPILSCPGAPLVLDWDTEVWPTASLVNSYTVAGESITITVTDPDNTLLSNANFGGQTPAESIYDTGGIVPGESDLHFLRDPPTQASTTDITISLGTAGIGVDKFQASIFDIDFGAAQFEDQITVTGTLGGTSVPVSFITNTANTASGNAVTGVAASTQTQSNGNMTLEFASAVDTVIITYGNGTGAPADPGNQGMALHDLYFCPAKFAVLNAQKITAVYDPLAEGLYMVPGNDVIYTIDVTNTGDGQADSGSIELIDIMPSEIEFYNGDIDDGGPETNPVAFSQTGAGLTFSYSTDVAYSNAATKPANYAACSYSPTAGYDPNVTFICFRPQGSMAAGTPDPTFQLKFRARIK